MDEVFIIMQIGNEELDRLCDEAMVAAIEDAGFTARRVDRHNTGDLLKSEIVQFIERSRLIVADLTNERPNCYLEVGYAMGLGKKANLILTAREDHHHSSPNYNRDGPKIHFDLEGYDILFWDLDDLPSFREALAERLQRRARIVVDTAQTADYLLPEAGDQWSEPLRERALRGLEELELTGYQEVTASVTPPLDAPLRDLFNAMRDASVHTFGWPIGVVLDSRDEYRPRPTADGIEAEIPMPGQRGLDRTSYDFWKLFRDGRFYTLLGLFEDSRAESAIFWDTRSVRVTESLLLLNRLYRRLGGSDTDRVQVRLRHGGLAGRQMRVANTLRMTHPGRASVEDVIETTLEVSLNDLETQLLDCVKILVTPLFEVFDYFELDDSILAEVVEGFAQRGDALNARRVMRIRSQANSGHAERHAEVTTQLSCLRVVPGSRRARADYCSGRRPRVRGTGASAGDGWLATSVRPNPVARELLVCEHRLVVPSADVPRAPSERDYWLRQCGAAAAVIGGTAWTLKAAVTLLTGDEPSAAFAIGVALFPFALLGLWSIVAERQGRRAARIGGLLAAAAAAAVVLGLLVRAVGGARVEGREDEITVLTPFIGSPRV